MFREWAMGMSTQSTLKDMAMSVDEARKESYAWESRDL
jgi:hypothetical protein